MLTEAEIETQTFEEIAVPCEFVIHNRPYVRCEHPAEWVVRVRCPQCKILTIMLLCDKDKNYYSQPNLTVFCSQKCFAKVVTILVGVEKL